MTRLIPQPQIVSPLLRVPDDVVDEKRDFQEETRVCQLLTVIGQLFLFKRSTASGER